MAKKKKFVFPKKVNPLVKLYRKVKRGIKKIV
jgi:hypothetical protein